jgi:hypothetical protein
MASHLIGLHPQLSFGSNLEQGKALQCFQTDVGIFTMGLITTSAVQVSLNFN